MGRKRKESTGVNDKIGGLAAQEQIVHCTEVIPGQEKVIRLYT